MKLLAPEGGLHLQTPAGLPKMDFTIRFHAGRKTNRATVTDVHGRSPSVNISSTSSDDFVIEVHRRDEEHTQEALSHARSAGRQQSVQPEGTRASSCCRIRNRPWPSTNQPWPSTWPWLRFRAAAWVRPPPPGRAGCPGGQAPPAARKISDLRLHGKPSLSGQAGRGPGCRATRLRDRTVPRLRLSRWSWSRLQAWLALWPSAWVARAPRLRTA